MTATASGASDAAEDQPTSGGNPTIQLGVVVTPALDEGAVEKLGEELAKSSRSGMPA